MISIRDFTLKLSGIPVSLKSKMKKRLVTGVITVDGRYGSGVFVGIANEILNGRDFPEHYGKSRTYFIFNSSGEVDNFIKEVTLQVGNSQIQVKETW
jgi:hypothetical protein